MKTFTPRQTFTQEQVVEMTMSLIKSLRPYVDWPEEELVKSVSKVVVEGLQIAGVELPWIRNIRKN
jgi:hypothetical protein